MLKMEGNGFSLLLLFLVLCSSFFIPILADSGHASGNVEENAPKQGNGMLFPFRTETRDLQDISGIWKFKLDKDNIGIKEEWWKLPLKAPVIDMPVPSSYNDVTQDNSIKRHIGWVWYEHEFFVSNSWQDKRVMLRFESAHYYTKVWINGVSVMDHNGGHLPFEENINSFVDFSSKNRLTVAVNNTLTPTTLPPGDIKIFDGTDHFHPKGYTVQITHFDFFNYAGIHRPVKIYTTPKDVYIDDFTLNYIINSDGSASISYNISVISYSNSAIQINLYDENKNRISQNNTLVGVLNVAKEHLQLWEPGNPYLYELELIASIPGKESRDIYRYEYVGIRTIQVTNSSFLINGKPFYFHGVDKHEDSNLRGKGLDNVLVVKDFNMLEWLGANSFRTSHYPYADEFYFMADRHGIVIIGECPAVGLQEANYFSAETLQHHKDVMFEMIRRDKNHPSVVMWNVANEPYSNLPPAKKYFQSLSEYTRGMDPTHRPLTLVQSVHYWEENCAEFFDVVCINRYFGWYIDPGHTEFIFQDLSYELDMWYQKYGKPMIVSEYGADTIPGLHKDPAVMFTEDYQVEFLEEYHHVFDVYMKKFLIGELVWNFADFETAQSTTRVSSKNFKGVLTRERQPKTAARMLRKRYHSLKKQFKRNSGSKQ